VLERQVEQYLRRKVKAAGGYSYKFSSPAHRGVPDRIVLLGGRLVFVELKAPGKRPTRQQLHEHQRLRDQGQNVIVIDSKEKVNHLIEAYT
jgi:hypothetical protein